MVVIYNGDVWLWCTVYVVVDGLVVKVEIIPVVVMVVINKYMVVVVVCMESGVL